MRKRSPRRRVDPCTHPMLQPTGPLDGRDLLDLRVLEHLAIDAISTWQGHRTDLRVLLVSAATSRELAALGYGADEVPHLAEVDRILSYCKKLAPGSIGVADDQLQLLRWLLQFHDGQRAVASCRDYHQALARVRREPIRYGLSLALA
jgi:hypothetical protein